MDFYFIEVQNMYDFLWKERDIDNNTHLDKIISVKPVYIFFF